MDMNPGTTGFFASISRSCMHFAFYKEAATQKIGKSIKYFFLLLLIAAVILSITYAIKMQQFVKEGQDWVIKYVPELRITNGKLDVSVPQPYTVWKDSDFIFLIDTTGQNTTIDTTYKAGILLTKTKAIMKQNEMKTQTIEFAQFPPFVVNKTTVEQWAKIGIIVLWIILPIGMYIYLILVKWLQIFLFSLFTLSLNSTMRTNLRYPQLLSIGIYAMTAPIILDVIYAVAGKPNNPIFFWLYIAVYAIYLIGAVRSQKQGI